MTRQSNNNRKDEKAAYPELKQFAGCLVDGVMKTVSESKQDNVSESVSADNDHIEYEKN